ncbi:MAG: hypothetical protein QXI71_02680 [Candidatus Bathyarchaeia archaeon]
MGPIKRKRFKFFLDPVVHKAFRTQCKLRGQKRVNRIIECFMLVCLRNPAMIDLVRYMAEKSQPNIFHEPTRIEGKIERIRETLEKLREMRKQ